MCTREKGDEMIERVATLRAISIAFVVDAFPSPPDRMPTMYLIQQSFPSTCHNNIHQTQQWLHRVEARTRKASEPNCLNLCRLPPYPPSPPSNPRHPPVPREPLPLRPLLLLMNPLRDLRSVRRTTMPTSNLTTRSTIIIRRRARPTPM